MKEKLEAIVETRVTLPEKYVQAAIQAIFSPEELADTIGCLAYFIRANTDDPDKKEIIERLVACIGKFTLGMPEGAKKETDLFLKKFGLGIEVIKAQCDCPKCMSAAALKNELH